MGEKKIYRLQNKFQGHQITQVCFLQFVSILNGVNGDTDDTTTNNNLSQVTKTESAFQ